MLFARIRQIFASPRMAFASASTAAPRVPVRYSTSAHRRAVLAVCLVTILVAAIALVPSRLDAVSSTQPRTTHATQKVPAALAQAIHSRLGPGAIRLGTTPLVPGIAATRNGWAVKSLSTAISGRISKGGATAVSLHGSDSVTLEAVSLNAGSTRVALAVQSSALTHGQLVQQLGAVRSLQHLTSAGLAQQFVIAHAPMTGAKSVVLDLASTQQWHVIRHGAAIEVRGG